MEPVLRRSQGGRQTSRARNDWALVAVAGFVCTLLIALIIASDALLLAYKLNDSSDGPLGFLRTLPGWGGRPVCKNSRGPCDVIEQAATNLLPQRGILHSVSRGAQPSAERRMQVSIPQTIWQTARTSNDAPPLAIDLFNSWSMYNQEFDHFFLDDEAVFEFVARHYNQSVSDAFRAMPLGVMRADAVRYGPTREEMMTSTPGSRVFVCL